jgi:hypothetical protein
VSSLSQETASSTAPRRPLAVRFALGALTVVGLIVYTLLFAELFIRLVVHQPILPRYVTDTPWGVRGNIPNARFWQHTSEVTASFHYNSQGMRDDRTFPLAKPAGVCRVALFGDSYFAGFELKYPDTYAYRLERALRQRGYKVEVLNFAVSGFGTAEHNKTYEGYARKFSPDLVLYEWHMTDFDDNVRSGLYRLKDGQLQPAAAKFLPSISLQNKLMKSGVYRFVADNSQLYNFLRENLARYAKRALKVINAKAAGDDEGAGAGNLGAAVYAKASPYAVSLSQALLDQAKASTARDNASFYVLEIPRPVSRTQFEPSITQMSPQFLGTLNLVQPTPQLTAAGRPDRKLYLEHGAQHLSPDGVGVILAASLDRIANDPRLQRCHGERP